MESKKARSSQFMILLCVDRDKAINLGISSSSTTIFPHNYHVKTPLQIEEPVAPKEFVSKVFQSVFDFGALSVYDFGVHPTSPLPVPRFPGVLQLWGIWLTRHRVAYG
jgi:hypothetical protein